MGKNPEVPKDVRNMCMGCALVQAGFTCAEVKPEEQLVRATVDRVCYSAKTYTPSKDALTHSCRVRAITGRWGWKNTYNAKL